MPHLFSTLGHAALGAGVGFMTGGPAGAVVGGASALVNGGGPSGRGNIAPGQDLTVPGTQILNGLYETANFGLEAEQLRHQFAMQLQSQQFNEVEDEKAEQMREMNTLRTVAMKQREADDKIVKEFIQTAGGE
ncbi:MAG: hypothetical protein NVSMB19_10860 [Vulcanimicrobiaceae bacterium]